MRKGIILSAVISALLLVVVIPLFWVLYTEKGTTLSLALAQKFLPALELQGLSGSWNQGIRIDELHWRQPETRLQINDLKLKPELLPLLQFEVRLNYLKAKSLEINNNLQTSNQSKTTLPNLASPVSLVLQQLAVEKILLRQHGEQLFSAQLAVQAQEISWKINSLDFKKLDINIAGNQLSATGNITLRGLYPLAITARYFDQQFQQDLYLKADGSLVELNITAKTEGKYSLASTGQINVLAPHFPFTAEATLANPISLAVAGHDLKLPQAQISVHGDLRQQTGQLKLRAQEAIYGNSQLTTGFQLNWPELNLNALTLVTEQQVSEQQGQVIADCVMQLQDRQWNCEGEIEQLDLAYWLKNPAKVSSPFSSQGTVNDQLKTFSFTMPKISGTVRTYSVTGDIAITLNPNGIWEIPGSSLTVGDNQISAEGWLGENKKLQIHWQFNDLTTLVPEIQGSTSGDIQLSGALNSLLARGQLKAVQMAWQNWQVENASASFEFYQKANQSSSLSLILNQIRFKQQLFNQAKLDVNGTTDQHRFIATLEGKTTTDTLDLNCKGSLQKPGWQGECADLSGKLRLFDQPINVVLDQPIKLKWLPRNSQPLNTKTKAALFTVSPACLIATPAKVCLPNGLNLKQGSAVGQFTLQHVPVSWLPIFHVNNLSLDENASFDANLYLYSSSPLKIDGSVTSNAIAWQVQREDEIQVGGIESLDMSFDIDNSSALLQVKALSELGTQIQAQLTVSDPTGSRALDGNIRVDVKDANEFTWLVQDISSIQGRAEIDMDLSGTLLKPQIQGQLSIKGSQLVIGLLDQPIQNYELSARFEGSSADYSANFQVGTGNGSLQGQTNWQNLYALQSNNQLKLKQVGVNLPGGGNAMFDAELQLDAQENQIITQGTVDLIKAHVLLDTLPPGSASVSSDTVVVGESTTRDETTRLITDVQVNLGDNLRFTGHGADFFLSGDLRLQNDQQHVNHVTGKVTVDNGQYRAYGQKLNVRKGELRFAGPLDNPSINLEAIRPSINDQIAGIRVTGSLQQPVSELFSEPTMSETDTAYYLVTGRKRPDSGMGEMSADAVLLSLGVSKLSSGVSKFAEQLGVQDFQVSANQTEEGTSAQVSGYLTPRLFISYGRDSAATGEENNAAVTLRYRLTQHLIIESISGFNSALDIFYSFEIE